MGDALLFISAAALVLVVGWFLYVFRSEPWIRQPFGQSVMTLSIGLLLLSAMSLLVYAFGPEYPGRDWLVVVGRALIIASIVQRTVILIRLQRADRAPHDPAPKGDA